MVQEALRLLQNDHKSSYEELLKKSNQVTLHICRLRQIVKEVFKSMNELNPQFMNVFEVKNTTHNLRDGNILIQPSFQTITYGRNTFSYYGAHLWNHLPYALKQSLTVTNFKYLLGSWEGPKCTCSLCTFNQL